MFGGEIEVDESYFCGKRKIKVVGVLQVRSLYFLY